MLIGDVMLQIINDFEKKTKPEVKKEYYKLACGKEIPIYTIESINHLNQFIGFGKYINCKTHNVYIRGQVDLYNGAIIPSLFRNKKNLLQTTQKFNERLNKTLKLNSFKQFPKPILEATIQHYGIRTPQIDLVDNVWIALWFATNEFTSKTIKTTEHVFVSKSSREYGYIFLIASDAITPSDEHRGMYIGKETTVIDLRKALPSYYLRPHAQHAYMLKKREELSSDYSDLVVGIAKIPVNKALQWIGEAELLSVSSLFPSPVFDAGYEVLLKSYPENGPDVVCYMGSIQHITD